MHARSVLQNYGGWIGGVSLHPSLHHKVLSQEVARVSYWLPFAASWVLLMFISQ